MSMTTAHASSSRAPVEYIKETGTVYEHLPWGSVDETPLRRGIKSSHVYELAVVRELELAGYIVTKRTSVAALHEALRDLAEYTAYADLPAEGQE